MFAFYFALGMIVIFWEDIPLEISSVYRILFGLLIVVYSFFRFIRLWQNR